MEEILKIGNDIGADFALQSGDLFHDLSPSQNCLCRTLKIFEEQVFGEREHKFKYYEQSGVNHEYMNLLASKLYLQASKRVKLPVVGIHGNHDYPMQASLTHSAYDMLSITKCVSYIGRVHELSAPVFTPSIFLRGGVAVAVYGVGHIKDVIMMKILEEKRYTFEPIPPEISKKYKCLKILLFHQNRFKVRSSNRGRRRKRSTELDQEQPLASRIRFDNLGT